jgi:hypothetical protein
MTKDTVVNQSEITGIITFIFANQMVGEYIITKAKNSKTIAQIRRAIRLEPHIKRIIWDADRDRDIFEKIKFMFDE